MTTNDIPSRRKVLVRAKWSRPEWCRDDWLLVTVLGGESFYSPEDQVEFDQPSGRCWIPAMGTASRNERARVVVSYIGFDGPGSLATVSSDSVRDFPAMTP